MTEASIRRKSWSFRENRSQTPTTSPYFDEIEKCLNTIISYKSVDSDKIAEAFRQITKITLKLATDDKEYLSYGIRNLLDLGYLTKLERTISYFSALENEDIYYYLSEFLTALVAASKTFCVKFSESVCFSQITEILKTFANNPSSFENSPKARLICRDILITLTKVMERCPESKNLFQKLFKDENFEEIVSYNHAETQAFALLARAISYDAGDLTTIDKFFAFKEDIFDMINKMPVMLLVEYPPILSRFQTDDNCKLPFLKALLILSRTEKISIEIAQESELLAQFLDEFASSKSSDTCVRSMLDVLWELSFSGKNKQLFVKDRQLVEELTLLGNNISGTTAALAQNILWALKQEASNNFQDANEEEEEFFSFLSEQPIMVNVDTPCGIVQVEIEHYAKVSTLKEKLYLKIGVNPFKQTLQFVGATINDDKTLTFYKIKHECIVKLVVVDKAHNDTNESFEPEQLLFYDVQASESIDPESHNSDQYLEQKLEERDSVVLQTKTTKTTTGAHVMISYCWAQQKIALKLYQNLVKAGLKVWLDREEMRGFLCERMAEGVENAFAIILLMSEDFQNSHACRAEANFSFVSKKLVIPLIAQANFSPSCGWLKVIVAGILYYEVHSNSTYNESFPKILDYLKMLKPDCNSESPDDNDQLEISRSGRSDCYFELSGYFSRRTSSDVTDSKRSCIIS